MSRGRPKLTQREKLNNKVIRLQKEIEEIQQILAGNLEDTVPQIEEKNEL